jgi:hypothetical protein
MARPVCPGVALIALAGGAAFTGAPSAEARSKALAKPPLNRVDTRAAYGSRGKRHRLPVPKLPVSVATLKRAPLAERFTGWPKRIVAPPQTKRIRLRRSKPHAALFGYHGDFYAKRNDILGTIDRFYRTFVPTSGGVYTAPALFELPEPAVIPPCTDASQFAYCPPGNYVVWAFPFYGELWDLYGDNAFAGAAAHEYGHGAQWWLNYQAGGYFQYVLYREQFADCMAGAYSYWMWSQNYYDNVDRGDGQELYDIWATVSDDVTTWDNHGDFSWRYGTLVWGWQQGWNGCIRYGNWIYGQ